MELPVNPANAEPPVNDSLVQQFERMLDGYQEKVFRLACGMLGNETAAQDATQDTFFKVWKALPGYRGGATPSSWIYTIARNTCLTELKRRQTRRHVSLADDAVAGEVEQLAATTTAPNAAGRQMDVQTLLAALPAHYRPVLTLFYLEQKSYEEVATMLEMPIGTVKTYLHRAKKELMRRTARRKESHEEF